ncbi:unnamed protein product [Sphagnum jensenii]
MAAVVRLTSASCLSVAVFLCCRRRAVEGGPRAVEKPGVTRGLSVTVGESGEEPGVTRGRRSLWGNQEWGGTRRNEGSSVTVGQPGEKPGVTRSRSGGGLEVVTRRNEG